MNHRITAIAIIPFVPASKYLTVEAIARVLPSRRDQALRMSGEQG